MKSGSRINQGTNQVLLELPLYCYSGSTEGGVFSNFVGLCL